MGPRRSRSGKVVPAGGSRWVGWLLLMGLLTGCQSGIRLDPTAPKEAYKFTEMEVRSERFLSTVHVPVSIGLADVERQLNAQVNGLIYEDNSPDDNNGDKLLTTANAGDSADAALFAKLGLKPMQAEEPMRAMVAAE